ncbi:MAG: hypothetical protein KatS3mg023_0053 [Armatimonadota bacterium]|nr:MAG: hypothetical protein KatS3mg023_0053 [Armatimonadota bacterium]
MKTYWVWVPAVALMCADMHASQSPLKVRDKLALPAFILRSTPKQWIEIYHLSESSPSALLLYLDDHLLAQKVLGNDTEAEQFRWYVLQRIGDVAPPGWIPRLEEYLSECEERAARAVEHERQIFEERADDIRLTIERIRLRSKGRDDYVRAMIEWVQSPDPLPMMPLREKGLLWRRMWYGARALGILQAREGVPALAERCEQQVASFIGIDGFYARALARIGDQRSLKVLKEYLAKFIPWPPNMCSIMPLEPGEPDPVWAYWQMRTEGMSLEQAIWEVIRTCEREVKVFRHDPPITLPWGTQASESRFVTRLYYDEILEYIGKPAVPALIRVLEDPKSSVEAISLALAILPRLQAVEAIQAIRKWLHSPFRTDAASALGTLRAREAVDDLIAVLQHDSRPSFKQTAIEALEKIGDPRAEPLLLSMATEDADENIRFVAVNALATVGSSATIPVLEERLQSEPVDAVKARIRITLEALRRKAR